jgi:aconitate decarboxylase
MTTQSLGPTRLLAEFIVGLRCEDVPSAVRSHAKLVLLDALGCAIYGAAQPWSEIVTRTIRALEPSGACAIWGQSHRCSAPSAALANGTMVQGFELDDYHAASFLHCGATAVPATLAVAEHVAAFRRGRSGAGATGSATGRQVLTAIVAGFEIGPRIGMAMGGSMLMLNGWHAGAVVGPFLAAAAAGHLLGLDADRMTHALGIAGTQAAGLGAVHFGAMVKRIHHGLAARNGTIAALLAENGLTGSANVLESDYGGFGMNFAAGNRAVFQPDRVVADLGDRWETLRVGFKPYACVGVAHTALDVTKRLRERHAIRSDQIERVVVGGSKTLVEHGGWRYEPRDVTTAQMNVGYSVAVLLTDGDCFVNQFIPAKILDPAVVSLARRVEVVEDPEIETGGVAYRNAAKVAIYLTDGTILRAQGIHPWGSDANPLTADEVLAKYRKLVMPILGWRRSDEIQALALGLEDLPDVNPLMAALV